MELSSDMGPTRWIGVHSQTTNDDLTLHKEAGCWKICIIASCTVGRCAAVPDDSRTVIERVVAAAAAVLAAVAGCHSCSSSGRR